MAPPGYENMGRREYIISHYTLPFPQCSTFSACFGIDLRCALPEVAEVPCVVSCLFITCYHDFTRDCRICATMADLGVEPVLVKVSLEGDGVELPKSPPKSPSNKISSNKK